MKRELVKMLKGIIRSLTFVFVIFLPTQSQSIDVVRLTNGDWPPYLTSKAPPYGSASQVVSEAFKLVGIEVQYGFFPAKRALEYAQKGDWDGSIAWIKTAERESIFYYSEQPVLKPKRVIFHLKTTPFGWEKIKDLEEWRIGTTIGYSYGEEFDNNNWLNRYPVARDELSIKKLIKGRIDIVPMEKEVAKTLMKSILTPEEMELVTYHPREISHSDYYLIISKSNKQGARLIRKFNKGLQLLRESGRYSLIMNGVGAS